MIRKFLAGSALVQAIRPDTRSGPERLAASPWATATTPDQLIVAHILESVAKDHTVWHWATVLPIFKIGQKFQKEIDIPFCLRGSYGCDLSGPGMSVSFRGHAINQTKHWTIDLTVVVTPKGKNAVPLRLEQEAAIILASRLSLLWHQLGEANKVAAQAQAAMEENEQKWNLAERLLGMTRNEHGALVPLDN